MRWTFLLLLSVVAACATSSAGPTRQANLITFQEIQELEVASAFEVVQILRPQYLRDRGAGLGGAPVPAVVYLDGFQHGSTPESLRLIPRTSIRQIEYLDMMEATTRYGTGHRGGAILVQTR